MKFLALLLLLAGSSHAAVPPYDGYTLNTGAGVAHRYLSGDMCIAANQSSAGTCTLLLNGLLGQLTATEFIGALTGNAATATSAATATALAAGGVGQIAYQSASGVTAFLPAAASGGIVVGNGTSAAPSTSTLVGTASQVVITKTNAPAALTLSLANPINVATSGNAATATAIAGGLVGQHPYQTSAGVTAFLPAPADGGIIVGNGTSAVPSTSTLVGTASQVTVTKTNAPNAITLSLPATINVNTSGTAALGTALAGGLVGQHPYQTSAGVTAFLPAPADGGIIVGNGTSAIPSTSTLVGTASQVTVTKTNAPAAVTLSLPATINVNTSGTAALGTAVAGGGAGQVLYQSGAGVTAFLPAAASGGIIVGNGTSAAPSTSTFVGTASQVVVTKTNAPAAMTLSLANPINVDTSGTAALATALAGGGAGQTSYQSGAGATAFLPALGAAGVVSGNGAAPSTYTLTGTASQVTITRTAAPAALTFSLPATINVNTSGTAALGTAIAGGLVGQIPYQTAAGVTAFLPAPASGGIVVGNGTSAVPSTSTFVGTANQVVIMKANAPASMTLSLANPINVATSGNAATATALAADGANCAAGSYPLGVDASGAVQGCTVLAGGGDVLLAGNNTMTGDNNFPSWTKYTKTNANFSSAGTSNTILLAAMPANTVIHAVKIKHSTAFSGTGITGYTVSVGTGVVQAAVSADAVGLYASDFDVFQVVSSSAMQLTEVIRSEGSLGFNLTATATSVGANLNAASGAGSVDIWVLKSVTP